MEKTIQVVNIRGEVYINRTDVISLVKAMCDRAESLSSKQDLKSLAEILSEGIEDYKL